MKLILVIIDVLGHFSMVLAVACLATFLILDWPSLVRWFVPSDPAETELKREDLFWWALLCFALAMACQVGRMEL